MGVMRLSVSFIMGFIASIKAITDDKHNNVRGKLGESINESQIFF